MENKFIFAALAAFIISLSCVIAVPYTGTINFNAGSTNIGVNVTGPGISINVTNTTTPEISTTTSGGGGGGGGAGSIPISSGPGNSNNNPSSNLVPLSGSSDNSSQSSESSSGDLFGITGTGAVIGALTSPAGIGVISFLILISGAAIFIMLRRKFKFVFKK